MPTRTYDNSQIVSPYGLIDLDKGFYNWWNTKLNLHLKNKDGDKKKVPVEFYTKERWVRSRGEGVRDNQGKIIAPIIVMSRTETADQTEGPNARRFADIQDYHLIQKRLDPKSSIVKNLIAQRTGSIDPTQPIFELYSHPVPDHFSLTYEVGVWTSYIEDMNTIIEKIGQEFNFKSKKSFSFQIDNGIYFNALKEDDISDNSNLEDYSGEERLIRKEYIFKVSAHIIPQSDERRNVMRRYFSQSRLILKNETVLSGEELAELLKKK